MEPIAQLLTGADTQFRGTILVPLAIIGLVAIGLLWMIGNQRTAQEKALAFFIGLTVVIGAPRIVTWVQSIVH